MVRRGGPEAKARQQHLSLGAGAQHLGDSRAIFAQALGAFDPMLL